MNLCRLTHDIPIFNKMIPNGHGTFKLGQRILVAALWLRLRWRVFGLFGRRTSLDQSMRMSRMMLLMLLMMMVMMRAAAVMAIGVQFPIALLPLNLMIVEGAVATRGDRDSCNRRCGWAARRCGMMIALMMMVSLPGAAPFHRIGAAAAAAVVMITRLMLLLIGIEAETILIIGMRCHLALSWNTFACAYLSWLLFLARLLQFSFIYFRVYFSSFSLVFVDGTLWFYFYCSADWLIDKTKLKRLNLELRIASWLPERCKLTAWVSATYLNVKSNKRIELQNKTKI